MAKPACSVPRSTHSQPRVALPVSDLPPCLAAASRAALASSSSPADLDRARALGNAMVLFMAVPWALCAMLYTFLHWSYPRDRARCMRPEPDDDATAAAA